ncbi:hypothetical protein M9Y10_029469 [Tritrichomonas musculus]|uniref:Protein kinase domain-containing protein n=1 Tax=Tritrichomonas musculus TaxID=1915356 RepID=A0ABR2KN39_9EUKA
MIAYFDDFQSINVKNPITMTNQFFNETMKQFTFIYMTATNFSCYNYNKKEIQFKKLFIDKCKISGIQYFVICHDNILLIINYNDINLLDSFFEQNSDSKIYSLSTEVIDDLISNEKINKNKVKLIKNTFKSEIDSFCQSFYPKKGPISKIWKYIQPCIASYLIKKAYFNSKIDRIRNAIQILKSDHDEINITKDNYISLRSLGNGSSSSVNLIYHIEQKKVFALKNFIDDKEKEKLFEREQKNYPNMRHPFIAQFFGTYKYKDERAINLHIFSSIY